MAKHLFTVPRLIQIGFVVTVFVLWYFSTATKSISHLFLPPLDSVYDELLRILREGQVAAALRTTLGTVAIAYCISVTLGISIGFGVTRSVYLMKLFEPLFSSLFAIPLGLLFPLFILFFGIGPESKVAFGATYSFFPVVLNTIAGLGYPNKKLVDAARSMGANSVQLFRRVLLPGAMPIMVTGLRIGFFVCFASVLGGETLSSLTGLGHQIAFTSELMEIGRMFAWILFAILVAFTLTMIVTYLESLRRDPNLVRQE
jgi:ABC-type nitrate/sulfonate/bicarbonate transport system permease component